MEGKMSWFKSAVSKAVEVGNKNNLTRIKNYADSVVHQAGQAVAEGAKIIQDRIATRNVKSFKQTVKRLEEASISCKGPERVLVMRRWLAALKEVAGVPLDEKEKTNELQSQSGETKGSPRTPVLYFDSDIGGEPMNFRDVFLYSQALEGITISMILEAPNEEEVALLLELYGICLTGGKEVHNAIVSSIQDLAKAFSNYEDEVLVKREELLQFTEGAISGLKVNADVGRIDAEISTLKKRLVELEESKSIRDQGDQSRMSETTASTIEALKETLAHIRACSRLEGLLLQKSALKSGDTPEVHAQKVDKLKVLSESLSSSSEKAEKRIQDNRVQKEEALKFRVAKSSEVTDIEKEITDEISGLEKQRDELEAALKKVNISLSAAKARLHNVVEERDQFYDANDQIVAHLKSKEEELVKSIGSCKVEATILSTWINFLEDTWSLQSSYSETKNKEIQDELKTHESYFVNLVTQLLCFYEKELQPSIDRIGKYVENLKKLDERSVSASNNDIDAGTLSPRKNLEEEYLDYEAKIITIFSVVDNMREQFYTLQGKLSSKEDPKVRDLFDKIEKLRVEFESVERPNLEMENPTHEEESSSGERQLENVSPSTVPETKITDAGIKGDSEATSVKTEMLDHEAELAKLESEFGKVNQDYSTDEIGGWEFDELEKELRSNDAVAKK